MIHMKDLFESPGKHSAMLGKVYVYLGLTFVTLNLKLDILYKK